MPALKSSSAVFAVRPRPPAAFSPLAITQSIPPSCRRAGMMRAAPRRPGWPKMSPTIRKRSTADRSPGGAGAGREAEGTKPARSSAGIIHDPHLSDDGHFDLARILHRLLDLLDDIAREARRRQIVHDIRL